MPRKMDRRNTEIAVIQRESKPEVLLASEILNSPEVSDTLDEIDDDLQYIHQTGKYHNPDISSTTIKTKALRFIKKRIKTNKRNSEKTNKRTIFQETRLRLESRKSEFNDVEITNLTKISKKLSEKPDANIQIIKVLLSVQEQNLRQRGLNEKAIKTELKHISDVVSLSQKVFPGNPILHFAAAVHDSYKHVSESKTVLGLHEVASTALGPVLLKETLLRFAEQLDISEYEVSLITKLAQRAIYTHGTEEFPANNTDCSQSPQKRLGELFGGLSMLTKKNSWKSYKHNQNIATETVAGLNYLDGLTGTDPNSFIKYNLFYSTPYIIEKRGTLKEYILSDIFSSFQDNITMTAGKLLRVQGNDALENVISTNTKIKNLIQLSAEGKFRELEVLYGEKNTNGLKHAFSKVKLNFQILRLNHLDGKNTKLNRQKFDFELNSYIILAEQMVKTTYSQK